jgi:hypothetical protein
MGKKGASKTTGPLKTMKELYHRGVELLPLHVTKIYSEDSYKYRRKNNLIYFIWFHRK